MAQSQSGSADLSKLEKSTFRFFILTEPSMFTQEALFSEEIFFRIYSNMHGAGWNMKFSGRVLHKTNLVFSLEPLVLEDLGQGGSFALSMSKAMFTLCVCVR